VPYLYQVIVPRKVIKKSSWKWETFEERMCGKRAVFESQGTWNSFIKFYQASRDTGREVLRVCGHVGEAPYRRSRMLSPQVGETGSALAKPLTDHTNTLERVPVQLPKIFPVL
jgi:hypothetical protein